MSTTPFVLKREANKEPFAFEVDGEKFTVPHVADIDQFELAELFARIGELSDIEYLTAFLDLFLAEEDRPRFRALRLNRESLAALYEAIQAHNGVNLGESSASST